MLEGETTARFSRTLLGFIKISYVPVNFWVSHTLKSEFLQSKILEGAHKDIYKTLRYYNTL